MPKTAPKVDGAKDGALDNPTTLRVPKGSVKRIMKMDDEVKMVAADAVFLMGKATVSAKTFPGRGKAFFPCFPPPSLSSLCPEGA